MSLPLMSVAESMADKNKKKRKLADMSVDEFMTSGFDSVSGESSENEVIKSPNKKKGRKKKKTSSKMEDKLKAQDPEFYEFLKNEDEELLKFEEDDEVSDEEESDFESDLSSDEEAEEKPKKKKMTVKSKKGKMVLGKMKSGEDEELEDILSTSDESEEESDVETGGKLHKPPSKLEVASDDEEESDDGEGSSTSKTTSKKKGTLVTSKMISHWNKALEDKPSASLIKDVVCAFKAAVKEAGHETDNNKYRVEGSIAFNGIVRMCLTHMSDALHTVSGLPQMSDLQKPVLPNAQNKKWKVIKLDTKFYLTYVLHLLSEMSETAMLNVILKHMHRLVAFYSSFPKLTKLMMKKMISLWSKGEETTRVLAFLCINKLILVSKKTLLEPCMKQMYMSYVKNSKFTSPSTIPLTNFMQISLVEIFVHDFILAYQYAFIYIRQLAIHLRNAITIKKKDNCQAVYNWQYVRCLELWVRLLSSTHPNEALNPLIYPLTQTIIGTIKLIPTARYYPLRFHLVKALNRLSSATDTFIPVLPFLLEVFEQTDFNRRHKTASFRPFNFACILKFSKSQIQEKAFKDGLIDQLYELLLDQLHIHSHSIGFPELVLPATLQLKDFLKKCKISNYCKQIKQIVDKVEETSKFITNRRRTTNISLADDKAVEAWERQCKESGTPLSKYYSTWRKLRDRELQHQIAQKDQIVGVDEIPVIERPKGPIKPTEKDKEEFSALFDTDSEESGDEERFLPKNERTVKKQKISNQDSDDSQEYSDFDSDELEILAKSGDEESASEEDMDDNSEDGNEEENEAEDDEEEDDDDKEDVVEDFQLSDSD